MIEIQNSETHIINSFLSRCPVNNQNPTIPYLFIAIQNSRTSSRCSRKRKSTLYCHEKSLDSTKTRPFKGFNMPGDRIRNFKNHGKDSEVSSYLPIMIIVVYSYTCITQPIVWFIFELFNCPWVTCPPRPRYKYSTIRNFQELRRRRTDATVELRKARKDEQLSKRRNIDTDETDAQPLTEQQSNGHSVTPNNLVVNTETVSKIVSDINRYKYD